MIFESIKTILNILEKCPKFEDNCLKQEYMAQIDIRGKLDKELSSIFKQREAKKVWFLTSKEDVNYSNFFTNKLLIIYIIRKGVPYSLFNLIQHFAPFSEEEWADILGISTKSLQRYRQASKRFKSIQSEKIIEMAEVTNAGRDVFEDIDKFKLWLNTPNYSLGNIKPMELLKDSYGKEMVIGELTRINHGILV